MMLMKIIQAAIVDRQVHLLVKDTETCQLVQLLTDSGIWILPMWIKMVNIAIGIKYWKYCFLSKGLYRGAKVALDFICYYFLLFWKFIMNYEKSRNFGPPDPFFHGEIAICKSAGWFSPPTLIGLTDCKNHNYHIEHLSLNQ